MQLRLRAPEPDDIDRLFRWENDEEQWRNSMTQPVISRHALWNYLNNFSCDPVSEGQLRLMVDIVDEDATSTVGTVDLTDYSLRDRRAFVSIFIAPDHRGRGIGRKALGVMAHMASECFGLELLAALATEGNIRSQRLFASAGFRLVATLPGWTRHGKDRENVMLYTLAL